MTGPSIRKSYTDGPYGQLHCRGIYPVSPSRAPLVLLHMSPKSGRSFHEVMPWLATHRTVIAPDYPGHGESDLPPAEPAVTVEDFARCVWAVIDDRLGDMPVHLAGYHTGSMVAVEATLQRPGQVLSVINIGAPAFSKEELEAALEYFQPIPVDEAGTRFKVMWERILHHRGPGMTLQMAAASLAENLRAGDCYEWGHDAAFAYAPKYPERLSRVTQPLLVMNPQDDTYQQTLRMDAYLNNGRRVDYPQWGHGFLNAFPEDAARDMLGFIESHETPETPGSE